MTNLESFLRRSRKIEGAATCAVCGSPVIHHRSNEGTQFYEPLKSNEPILRAMVEKAVEALGTAESILIYFETQPKEILGSDAGYAESKREQITKCLADLEVLAGEGMK